MMDHTYARSLDESSGAEMGSGVRSSVIRYVGKIPAESSTTRHSTPIQIGRGWHEGIPTVPNHQGDVIIRQFKDSIVDVLFINLNGIKNPEYFLNSMTHILKDRLRSFVDGWKGIKYSLWLECKFYKPFSNNLPQHEILVANFKTKMHTLLVGDKNDIEELLRDQYENILNELESFERKSSGWSLFEIDGILLKLTKYIPLKGRATIPLPLKIARTKSVVNVVNIDEYCFKYAILGAYTSPGQCNITNPSFYNTIHHNLDFSCITFPVKTEHITKFERQNHASVNLYALDDSNDVYPYRISPLLRKVPQNFNLLFLKTEDTTHYCYIRNLSRLVSAQVTNHDGQMEMCERCFQRYYGADAKKKLTSHEEFCGKIDPCRYEFPKHSHVEFTKIKHMAPVPIVIYGDIECLLKPLTASLLPNNEQEGQSWTIKRDTHLPTCAGMYLKSYCPSLLQSEMFTFSGANCLDRFMGKLKEICQIVETLYKSRNIEIKWTPELKAKFDAASNCEICHISFSTPGVKKNPHHDHLTGEFRYSLCDGCNLKLKLPKFIPIYFHNLSGYDGHFLVKKLTLDDGSIEVLAKSSENYISFSKIFRGCQISARFLDSFRFLSTSLSKLVETSNSFPELNSIYPNPDDSRLLLRKGVYPYNHINNWDVLQETCLPPKEKFYSDLSEEGISDEDYNHAHTVWNHFKIKNLMEYTELYMKSDILLLADIYENYRKVSRLHYGIDPSWYYTSPSYFWDAMLKKTGVKLEILKDIDMLQFIETGIRGGITQCVKRHAIANNPQICETFDPSISINHLIYLDVNNLYGYAMGQSLPYGNFKWVDDIDAIDYHNLPSDGEIGYIFDVDVEYPTHLHDDHSDLPFFPESLSPPGGKVKKLLTTLQNKKHYVTHYLNLIQALQKGLKVSKVHRILSFHQSKWLSGYMDFNTDLRVAATSDFLKDYYKLANNAVFGRSMMNKRNFKDFRLVTSDDQLLKLSAKPNFRDRYIFQEDQLLGVSMDRKKVKFDAPIYVGFSILEISKEYMYRLFYDTLRPAFGGSDNVDLVYMDTDAYILDVKVPDIYSTLKTTMSELMDFSDYPADHSCFSTENKKVVGKLKDETKSIPIKQVVALRPKLYSLSYGSRHIMKCKGVKKSCIKKNVNFDDYLKTLKDHSVLYCTFRKISSKLHNVSTTEHHKVGLSFFDDKRMILEDGVHTVPYGYRGSKQCKFFNR